MSRRERNSATRYRRFFAGIVGCGLCAVLECLFGYAFAIRDHPTEAKRHLVVVGGLLVAIVGLLVWDFLCGKRR